MSISLESLIITALFLLPSFFVFYTRRYIKPATRNSPDNFELTLWSFGYGFIISIFEALLFSLFFSLLKFDVSNAITNWKQFVIDNFLLTTSVIFLWLIIGILLALFIGKWDPYHYVLKKIIVRQNYTDTDIWHNLLKSKWQKHDVNVNILATVHLSNGDLYSGYLNEFENNPDEEGHRNFILNMVTFFPGKNANPNLQINCADKHSFVLLNTREISSLDFQFVFDN